MTSITRITERDFTLEVVDSQCVRKIVALTEIAYDLAKKLSLYSGYPSNEMHQRNIELLKEQYVIKLDELCVVNYDELLLARDSYASLNYLKIVLEVTVNKSESGFLTLIVPTARGSIKKGIMIRHAMVDYAIATQIELDAPFRLNSLAGSSTLSVTGTVL